MPGFEIGLSALVAAIKFLFETIGGQIAIPAEKRKKWFVDHIEPSYEQLRLIHEDYIKQFSNAVDLLNKGTDLEEVVQVLKRERPNLLLKRQEVHENLLAMREYRLERKRRPKVVLIFSDYVASVDGYLNAASPLPRETWYSYFIEEFSVLVEQGKNPLEYEYPGCAQGKDAPALAKEQLELAVQKNMPEALRIVQENYAKLRVECLSQV
jgi:hypothetical protein